MKTKRVPLTWQQRYAVALGGIIGLLILIIATAVLALAAVFGFWALIVGVMSRA